MMRLDNDPDYIFADEEEKRRMERLYREDMRKREEEMQRLAEMEYEAQREHEEKLRLQKAAEDDYYRELIEAEREALK